MARRCAPTSAAGDPIHRHSIVKPGDREFLQFVLSPGARAIAIPVATGGASTGLLYPGDRVDVILTQKFGEIGAPLTRRSVSETVVENLRVLVIDALDTKAPAGQLWPHGDARGDARPGREDQRRRRTRQIVVDLAQRQRRLDDRARQGDRHQADLGGRRLAGIGRRDPAGKGASAPSGRRSRSFAAATAREAARASERGCRRQKDRRVLTAGTPGHGRCTEPLNVALTHPTHAGLPSRSSRGVRPRAVRH